MFENKNIIASYNVLLVGDNVTELCICKVVTSYIKLM